MKKLVFISIPLLLAAAACKSKNPLADKLPDISGFETEAYKSCSQEKDPNGLSECLDGWAAKIIPLGVLNQVFQNYVDPASCKTYEDGEKVCRRTVGAEITEFATEEGAFGYFSINRNPPVEVLKGIKNGEGFGIIQKNKDGKPQSGDIYTWKGKYVFRITADKGQDVALARKTAKQLAADTAGQGKKPAQLALLPEEDMVPFSQSYTIVDSPLYEELRNVVIAHYTAPNKKIYKIFIADCGTPAKAKSIRKNWLQYAKKNLKDTSEEGYFNSKGFSYVSGLGDKHLIIQKKKYIFGAYGPGIVQVAQAGSILSLVNKKL